MASISEEDRNNLMLQLDEADDEEAIIRKVSRNRLLFLTLVVSAYKPAVGSLTGHTAKVENEDKKNV
uniref:Uncharacterized protein n=1 Tax=Heterorhabditis bacteriophora TaxID=37862 RepID=A0A1I7WZ93_HETBA